MKRTDIEMTSYLKSFLSFDLGHLDEHECPERTTEIAYVPGLKADLYVPKDGKSVHPLIIVIFGGGWVSGFRRDRFVQPMLKPVRLGYAVAVPDYTLALDAAFPQALLDIKRCIQYFRRHAEEYGIDPARIALWGESAGGHLALEAGLVGQDELSVGGDDQVQSVIALYPLTDPLSESNQAAALQFEEDSCGSDSVFSIFMGDGFHDERMMRLASPVCHLNDSMPRIILQHGTADRMVPYLQSTEFMDRAREMGLEDRVTLELAEGKGHTDPWFFTDENVAHLMEKIG